VADSPGNNLSKTLYFVLQAEGQEALQLINLLFARLFNLIISSIMQMGRLVLNATQGRYLDQIFKHKLPKIRETKDIRHLIGTKIITYCKWLIYTAPIKNVDIKLHMQIHQDFYCIECEPFKNPRGFSKRLKAQFKIRYHKHLLSKRQKANKSTAAMQQKIQTMNLPGAKLHMVLPDSEVEDNAGGGARSPGSSNNNKSD
jgi:hypothetical protein